MAGKEEPKLGYHPWWFEEAYTRYPRSYIAVVVGAGILWFLLVFWMSVHIGEGGPPGEDNLPWDIFTFISATAISVCLCLQLLALPYLLGRLRIVFDDLIEGPNDACEDAGICLPLYNFSSRCRWCYLGGGLLMLPLLAILLAKVWNAFDRVEHTQIAWVLDVSNTIMVLLQVYLLLVNIWVLIVMAWVLHRLRSRGIIDRLDINPHSPDRMGGLGPLHEVLTYFLSVYFVSMVCLILWYMARTPPGPAMLVILAYLGLGLALLFYGFRSIHRLVLAWIENAIRKISGRIDGYDARIDSLTGGGAAPAPAGDAMSTGEQTSPAGFAGHASPANRTGTAEDDLDTLKTKIELRADERDRLREYAANVRVYNLRTLLVTGVPILMAFLPFVVKIEPIPMGPGEIVNLTVNVIRQWAGISS